MPESNPNNHQVDGVHYQGRFQHWDFVESCLDGRYLEGCITKYLSRWRKKNGLKDLLKSRHCMEKLIYTISIKNVMPLAVIYASKNYEHQQRVQDFCSANGMTTGESNLMHLISNWRGSAELELARLWLDEIIEPEQKLFDDMEQQRQDNP